MNKLYKTITLIIPFLLMLGVPAAQAEEGMVIERSSPLGFQETIDRLIKNGKSLGWKLPKKWRKNFQKNLKKVAKVDIGPAIVVEMCEPWEAAKLLKHDKYKLFLSMMPCTVAVYEKTDGKVYLSMMNIQMMAKMYQGKEIDEMIAKLGPQMDQMLNMQ